MDSSPFGFASTAEQVTDGVDLRGTTWLVTGCTSGLGRETVRVLGLRGAHVVGLARTAEGAQAALDELGVPGRGIGCDLAEPDSVRRATDAVGDTALDGVIANAGIMALPTLEQRHGVELQLLTNHVGHHLLVTRLLPRLTPAARVVVLSSAAHFGAKDRGLELDNLAGDHDYHPWRMYARSKLANILFARALAHRLAATDGARTANAVHPGVIATNLARHVPNPEGLFARMRDSLKTVGQGAATQCYVAVRPELRGVRARYFDDCREATPLPLAESDEAAEALWDVTEGLLARI